MPIHAISLSQKSHFTLKSCDSMVVPTLLYYCEIWGFKTMKENKTGQLHVKFCKRTLEVRCSTQYFMVNGKLGRFLLEIWVKIRMLSFVNLQSQCNFKIMDSFHGIAIQQCWFYHGIGIQQCWFYHGIGIQQCWF